MVDKAQIMETRPTTDGPPPPPATIPPKRSPGHRGADVRDTVAEMAAKAQEISQEAGSKMAAAMKDVISAAAGLTGFAIESARDLVQYMVRRGQMTQEEADKLIREAEIADAKRNPHPVPPPSRVPKPPPPERTPEVISAAVQAGFPPRPSMAAPPRVEVVAAPPVAPRVDKARPVAPPARPEPARVAAPAAKKTAAKPKKKAATGAVKAKAPAKAAAKKKVAAKR
jgi:polyhydroxyalkanoate synthesis regulator phasin